MKFKIRHKLFLTILLTSTIVAISLSLFLQWNFDKGFINYVENQELVQLDHLAVKLADLYADEGKGWQFIEENHALWQAVPAADKAGATQDGGCLWRSRGAAGNKSE